MTPTKLVTLVLRVTMETAIVAAFCAWGWHAGGTAVRRTALAIAAPVVGFGLWGLIDFRQAGTLAEPLRLVQEMVLSLLAALALYSAGLHALAWGLALLTVAYHALVYVTGQRLLKQEAAARA